MLFTSYSFWVFFVIVLVCYRACGHKWQNRLLLVASWVFYGFWDWRYLFLLLFSGLVDYGVAIFIDRSDNARRRRALITVSVAIQLSLLGVFKYYDFFAGSMSLLLTRMGIPVDIPILHLVLPVGISFYTFQTMSYTIDVYRRQIRPTRDLVDFLVYISFFPQLVAGPIERATQLMPQVLQPRVTKPGSFSEGLYYVLFGLFCKLVVADNMASIANTYFSTDVTSMTGGDCLTAVYAFAFQIYGDFAGYSLIAVGISRWLGFDLLVNFRMPYLAVSPADFWRRWHISLSRWLRDYLYISLGGNRGGTWKTYRNLMLTMFLGGLWHGANWTFIAWGVYHGALLVGFRMFDGKRADREVAPMPRWQYFLRAVVMFHLVCIGWLLFRAVDIGQAWGMLTKIFTDPHGSPFSWYALSSIAFYCGPLLAYEIWVNRSGDLLRLTKSHWMIRAGVYAYLVLMMVLFPPRENHEFIYFQF